MVPAKPAAVRAPNPDDDKTVNGLASYRREAAELLAASTQRRRRRTGTDPIVEVIVEVEEERSVDPVRRRRPAPTRPQDD